MTNKGYYISVGEPWNFESPDGKNIIKGNVIKKINNNLWIFKSNHLVDLENIHGNIFLLQPRYAGHDFSDWQSGSVTVSGSILSMEYNDDLTEQEMFINVKAGIIGTLTYNL